MESHAHNLLGAEEKKRRKAWKYVLYGVLGFLAFVVVIGTAIAVPALLAAREVYAQAVAGRDALFSAKEAAEQLDFSTASGRLEEAAQRFDAAQRAERKLKPFKALPFLEKDLNGVYDLLEGGREASLALKEAIDVGADLVAVLKSGGASLGGVPDLSADGRTVSSLSREERRVLLQNVSQAPDRLAIARTSLDRALAAWDRVEKTPFTEGVLASIEPYKEQLRSMRDLMTHDLSPLAMLPSILGYPEPKTYLFLMLNNTELRPGGGFIGTYGILDFADAEITEFFTDDIYALDGPSEAYMKEIPPAPLRTYLRVPVWYMRDSNWSPDFAVSAMNVEKFYRLEGGKERLDGVIGITPTLVSKLLAITGPITVDGSTFTSENVTDELEYRVEVAFWTDGTPQAQRKDVVGKLGQELIKRLLGTKLSQLAQLADVAQEALKEKHMMAYFHDSTLQTFADASGWTGRFRSAANDRLAIIDANLASLKTDAVMDRTISYTLRPDGDSWIARASITYKNNGRFNWKTTRYRTYTRFYAPLGSTFIKGEGMMVDDKLNDPRRRVGTVDVTQELGHAVFGAFISIEPGETRTLAMEYRVSDAVAKQIRAGTYVLDAQKQLGTLGHGLTLDLDFGKNVARATPPESPNQWGDTHYRLSTDLRTDRQFTVGLK
ncbi:MAG: DUF4012 domain-containing protein [Patescibacteria group bacterium]|nr:MAG: DUF4012 domain-containing protein [Patescibacteria group bacterium]